MNSNKFVSALFLTAGMLMSFTATATNVPVGGEHEYEDVNFLHTKAKYNKNLEEGEYIFGQIHDTRPSTFLDEWKFTLAEDSNVSISIFDIEVPIANPVFEALMKGGGKGSHHSGGHGKSNFLVDNKFLTFSLFDHDGNLLGTAGEDGTLSALNLLGGEWYTLTVSAKVNGLLGSFYHGSLNVESVQEVPLGDSLPLFGSALLVLAVRSRKSLLARFQHAG